ncbi:transcription cofactor vestigial-like protein 1 isoform X5 [Columba livia]|uniref:transcription cofactor vestigial-like protein 1 isoform X5 n=1 Tax=Columba livia TaxID=8932 RepID=UPI0031BB6BFB
MEGTRKLSPKPSESKEPVKTEWGSQSVVFTYFQGDINSMVDEHFSRALSNAKNPQDLSTKHRGETVVLKNGEPLSMLDSMPPHQWNFSSHCSKPYPSSSATSVSNTALNFSAAGMAGQYQPSALRHHPTQPADSWPFPSIGTPNLTSSERCLTSVQECTMKQHSISACMTGPARLQNISQSSAPGGERKASSYQGLENPSESHATAGIQINDRRRDLYF